MGPRLDLEFYASPFYYISREEEFIFWIKVKLHNQDPITLDIAGSVLDPLAIFAEGRIQLFETDTGYPAPLQNIPSRYSNQEQPLTIDPQRGSFLICWSTTPERGDREKYLFNAFQPAPNTRYTLRYQSHGLTKWYPGTPEAPDLEAPVDPLTVSIQGPETFNFLTQISLPGKPPLTTCLSTSQPICALSGDPPFTISILWTLTSLQSITALRTVDRGRPLDIEIRDLQRNSRRIGLQSTYIGGDESPPEETELIHLTPGRPFRQSYTLSTETRAGGLRSSDMRGLATGFRYSTNMRKVRWRWRFDDEIDEWTRNDEGKLRAMLLEKPAVEFQPEGRVEFEVE
ncbi:MAG: hypothetical protein Q9227_007153 [Pyrenula ochraceoflavens]